MIHLPQPQRKFRWMALLYAAGLLVWFSFEDDSPRSVILLGLGAAALMLGGWAYRQPALPAIRPVMLPLVGSATGLLLGLLTSVNSAGLMFFKDALHAHLFPDYPPGLMLAVLSYAPLWALSGLLCGLGGALLYLAVRPSSQAAHYDE